MATIPALLAEDYRKTKRQLDQFSLPAAPRQGILQQQFAALINDLEMQMTFEELVIYPLLQLHVDGRSLSLVALAEHQQIRAMGDELRDAGIGKERWWATMLVFDECLRRHIEREQRELLPWLRRSLTGGMLREFAGRYLTAKATAPAFAQTST